MTSTPAPRAGPTCGTRPASRNCRPARTRRLCAAPAAACYTSTTPSASTATARCWLRDHPRDRGDSAIGSAACCACWSPRSRSGARQGRHLAEGGSTLLWQHPQVRAELVELFDVLARTASTTSTSPLTDHPDVPLQVHARYTRLEILAAFGVGKRSEGRAVADRRVLGGAKRRPTCSPSPSTRPAASSPRRPATATTPSAAT